jgi:UDP-N-acetylmuramate--alanine ligase
LVGDPELFVSEVDESDGSIALYKPEVAVLTNISLDHKEMGELRQLFAHFLARSRKAVLNLDDPEVRVLSETIPRDTVIGYGFDSPGADFMGKDLQLGGDGVSFAIEAEGERHDVSLAVPGRHNASNALAAIAATRAIGVRIEDAVNALARFEGLRRRLETVGKVDGVTVIDDFAHNPDKIAALWRLACAARPAADHVPAARLRPLEDGRAARAAWPAAWRRTTGSSARPGLSRRYRKGARIGLAGRAGRPRADMPSIFPSDRGSAMRWLLRPDGDRILIMGARDDTLIDFARPVESVSPRLLKRALMMPRLFPRCRRRAPRFRRGRGSCSARAEDYIRSTRTRSGKGSPRHRTFRHAARDAGRAAVFDAEAS